MMASSIASSSDPYDPSGKGKARASPVYQVAPDSKSITQDWHASAEDQNSPTLGAWRRSRARARADRQSWDYRLFWQFTLNSRLIFALVLSSGLAGGIAGCIAKTAIAPLDRVKILFQTSNADFSRYAGRPLGLLQATAHIYRTTGLLGLFQGHSATLLRIFPYAGIKFMTYDYAESVLIPTPSHRTPTRYFVAGVFSGVTSVLLTYPLELIRVRLAYQTTGKVNLREAIRTIHHEADIAVSKSNISAFTRNLPFYPFYRGFSISIIGMIPYAGVSFLTYGTLKRHIPSYIPYLADKKTQKELVCGAVAGAVSQTASYPFEVIRRRMQVGGVGDGGGVSWRDAVKAIYGTKGWKGFFVGLSIGYVKVVPMTSISFATWQLMKGVLEI